MLTRRQFHRRLAAAAGALAATTTPASALRRASGQTTDKQTSGKKLPPGTAFIGHGPGRRASIGGGVSQADLGGYPRGEVAPGGSLDALLDKYPNLYGDLSAGSGAGAISRDLDFGREFLVRRADRLMFGADFLSLGQAVPQFELFEKLDLPDDVRAKISRDNARQLLPLS